MIPDYLDIPIFPLPNVTLFPRMLLPLHIFELRYREMAASCLQGDKLIGVALLREGWQRDYFGRPPIHKTFGVGKIIDHETLKDGRFNLMVEGLYRVRLVEEHESEAFRVGRASVLRDRAIDHKRLEVGGVQKELFDACRALGKVIPKFRDPIQSAWASHPHPGVTADLLASCLVVDAYDRQSILEEADPLRRMKLTLIQIKSILACVAQTKEVAEEVLEEE